jgi:hypothetical protein
LRKETTVKSLTFNKERVRVLVSSDLEDVGGGRRSRSRIKIMNDR